MQLSTILDHIDLGQLALPEFQRGYVWNRDQVRGLMQSLYRRYPVGSLLVWTTPSEGAHYRGDGAAAPGVIKLLLDGQQRITSLYGIIRGRPPQFFDGNEQAFTGLMFNVKTEEFQFYSPVYMAGESAWVSVSELMLQDIGPYIDRIQRDPDLSPDIGEYISRLNRVQNIRSIDLHIEEVTGEDKTIDVVVDIFNRVNSGGTKLSKGDLALAKICAAAPDARELMKDRLAEWREADYSFELDWLLRSANAITTGQARFAAMHDLTAEEFRQGLKRTDTAISALLNLIAGRLGLDHDRVLFGRYAMPVMCRYLDLRGGRLSDATESDRLLYWYVQSAMWGRYSGSTETYIARDLEVMAAAGDSLANLIRELDRWRGSLSVRPEDFAGWSLGARFYPVLYMLTRVRQARDWGAGLPLSQNLLGKMNRLEVHHIFPKSLLYKHGCERPQVNAVANYCFLTKDTNLQISDRAPEAYFEEIESKFPGALESQWIPMDRSLWRVDRYLDFLEERRRLLTSAANDFLNELSGGLHSQHDVHTTAPVPVSTAVQGGIEGAEEEELVMACNDWIAQQGLPPGELMYEVADDDSGNPLAVLDLAWSNGIQEGLSEPVALLLNEPIEVLQRAAERGFRCFTEVDAFKEYVRREILALSPNGNGREQGQVAAAAGRQR